jgi:hypothetical protein
VLACDVAAVNRHSEWLNLRVEQKKARLRKVWELPVVQGEGRLGDISSAFSELFPKYTIVRLPGRRPPDGVDTKE